MNTKNPQQLKNLCKFIDIILKKCLSIALLTL